MGHPPTLDFAGLLDSTKLQDQMAKRKSPANISVEEPDEELDDHGIETEEDLANIPRSVLQEAVVFSTDWTTEVLINQLAKGNIDLDPAFQRRDAWTVKRKSLFIESLIAGLPVPQIVLAEKNTAKGTFLVIDGKQRLLSLLRFTKEIDDQPAFELQGLTLRPDLNGYDYSSLQSRMGDLNSFENQTIRTVVIRNWKKEDLLYLIFHRLNSETLPLSPQELRQALHPGPFLTFCDQHSQDSDGLKRILRLKKPDFRMRDIELLVRFYAFYNFADDYSGNLKGFLDETCERFNKQWKTQHGILARQAKAFEEAVALSYEIFDGFPFRKWDGALYETRFNRAIYDVMTYFFASSSIRAKATLKKGAVESAFKDLCLRDGPFVRAIESTTKSKGATSTRFNHWATALSKALGITIEPPSFYE